MKIKYLLLLSTLILDIQLNPTSYFLTRRVKLNNQVEEILTRYPELDREGFLELIGKISEGGLATQITLKDLELFLTCLEETQTFYQSLFGESARKIKKIRFHFLSTRKTLRMNTRDAELTIYPNSPLFETAIKNYPKVIAIEEVTHLYTAPGVAISYPCLQSFLDVLRGKIPHPFLQGFNPSLDFSKYFKRSGGLFEDWNLIDAINEVLNVAIALRIYGERYREAGEKQTEAELEEYKKWIENSSLLKNSQGWQSFLPTFARFELTFRLLGAWRKANEVRIYIMENIPILSEDPKRGYSNLLKDLETLITNIELKEPFRRKIENSPR